MGISFVYISKSLNVRVRIKNNFHRIKVCVFLNALSHLPTICSDEFSVNLTESEGNEPDPPQSDRSSFNDLYFVPRFFDPRLEIHRFPLHFFFS